MIEKIAIFIIFLAPLIFFHELGHFLFARFFKVRVEAFSLGFGPKLLKYKKGDTEYSISLIPLGGYVKMFGEDPLKAGELTEEEKKVAFTSKGKWARFWIVFGGPLANMLLAWFIYFSLLMVGEKVPSPKIGMMPKTTVYFEQGLRSGDVLKEIGGYEIASFDDLNNIGDPINEIVVMRNNQEVKIGLGGIPKIQFIGDIMKSAALLRAPLVINAKKEIFALSSYQDQLQLGLSFEELMELNQNETYYLHPVNKVEDFMKLQMDFAATPDSVLPKSQFTSSVSRTKVDGDDWNAALMSAGLYPMDLQVQSIVMDSPAEKEGLSKGDIITQFNGENLTSFEDLRLKMQLFNKGEKVKITVLKNGTEDEIEFNPEIKTVNQVKQVTIGVYSSVVFVDQPLINTPSKGVIESIKGAFSRTYQGCIGIFDMFKKLIFAEISVGNLGGPLSIGKVAHDSFTLGFSMFLRLMAMISINLGLINLFPIPVLDGGHIVFILLEIINGGPLSRKKIQVAQQFGLSLLFLLIFIALYNDVSRFIIN